MKVTLCIPVLNAGKLAKVMVEALKRQSFRVDKILIVDSASSDDCIHTYTEITSNIISIRRDEFDHGGTRNLAFQTSDSDFYVFLTQDAIPDDVDAIKNLIEGLIKHPECGLVYGRQKPDETAGIFARHARLYNYPDGSQIAIKGREDIPVLGIKTAFCSNSFSAYRSSAMEQIGYFPLNTLFAEDSIAAAKLIQQGWKIAYAPHACVVHSHDYTLSQEFKRYFDVGAFHSMNNWYMDMLGKAEGEGKKFVRSEYEYAKSRGVSFPMSRVVIRNAVRWMGYKTGKMQAFLPNGFKRYISTNKAYWTKRMLSAGNQGEGV